MNVLDFGMEIVAVSASGVLAPGPLFFMNLLFGSRFGMSAGLRVANGHALVEVPFIVFLATGLIAFNSARNFSDIIAIIGGVAILVFAALQLASVFWEKRQFAQIATVDFVDSKSPFVGGIVLTAFNPFFLIWWFTVGLKLILDSAMFGFTTGLASLLAFHIWMDYAWLSGTAYLAFKGSKLVSSRYYPILVATLSAVLAYYGISFIIQGS
jgi:threonine/homoserine/homoserine lactone efflux protein